MISLKKSDKLALLCHQRLPSFLNLVAEYEFESILTRLSINLVAEISCALFKEAKLPFYVYECDFSFKK